MNAHRTIILVVIAIVTIWTVVRLFRDGVLKVSNPKMNAFYKALHLQHEAGWFVVLDGERIGVLDYLRDDQPFHLFRFTPLTQDEAKINFALQKTAWRDPSERVVLENRVHNVRLGEVSFIASLYERHVRIRDWRHWKLGQPNHTPASS